MLIFFQVKLSAALHISIAENDAVSALHCRLQDLSDNVQSLNGKKSLMTRSENLPM